VSFPAVPRQLAETGEWVMDSLFRSGKVLPAIQSHADDKPPAFATPQKSFAVHSAARCPQSKRASPRSPTLQSLNTETTESLGDLCVEFFPVTEDTGALLVREEIFARRQELWE
jgi:hypothetical protein